MVGDVLEVEAGDAVAADARLLQTANLSAEESSLTGESVPVQKDALAAVADDAPLGDRSTMLFVGTSIVRGKGRAVVTATAVHTALGKLSALIHRPRDRTTPLEEKLDAFGKRVLWACLGLSGLLFLRGYVKGGRTWHELLLEAVSLAVAAIPEGLPAITTITLALGMQRMARRGAIVRKLAAVETLGSATVICTDKTGTLTQNEMTVRVVYAGGERYKVTGIGYDPRGSVLDTIDQRVESPDGPLRDLLATVALCNNARLQKGDDGWRVLGDPTEGALLTLAAKGGVPRGVGRSSDQVRQGAALRQRPQADDHRGARRERARGRAHRRAAPTCFSPLCAAYADRRRPGAARRGVARAILDEAERMSSARAARARRGATGPRDSAREPAVHAEHDVDRPSAELENQLTFLGLVGMIDPPREGVKEAVRLCAEAHVRAVMITGDHKLTAVAIAKELGLWDEGAIALTGAELRSSTTPELDGASRPCASSRASRPSRSSASSRAFKRAGHIVAMTGDGVNDAPALREAHIGVAMGKERDRRRARGRGHGHRRRQLRDHRRGRARGARHLAQHPEVHLLPALVERGAPRRRLRGELLHGPAAAHAAR